MHKNSLALLMFNYNENTGIIRNIELLKNTVDEILIIDSSDTEEYMELYNRYQNNQKIRIIRVFPIGYVEPFRNYALKKIRSEWVFLLDADEEPNEHFISDLKNTDFQNASAYNILRFEETLRCYDYQLRLYKRENAVYKGMIHEFPVVIGAIKDMDERNIIIHHADFSNYLKKRGSYLTIEAYERPFTPFYLSTKSLIFNLFRDKHRILGKHYVLVISLLFFLKCILSTDSIKYKSYRNDWFYFRYTLKRYNYFAELPNREELVKINEDIIRNGGIIKYLNLDDVNYVENLTKNFRFDKKGLALFEELIDYRYRNHTFNNEI